MYCREKDRDISLYHEIAWTDSIGGYTHVSDVTSYCRYCHRLVSGAVSIVPHIGDRVLDNSCVTSKDKGYIREISRYRTRDVRQPFIITTRLRVGCVLAFFDDREWCYRYSCTGGTNIMFGSGRRLTYSVLNLPIIAKLNSIGSVGTQDPMCYRGA